MNLFSAISSLLRLIKKDILKKLSEHSENESRLCRTESNQGKVILVLGAGGSIHG